MSSAAPVPFLAALMQARLPVSGVDWLDAARRENLAVLLEGGLPDTRNEAWKYTPLRALAQRAYVQGDEQAGARPVDRSLLRLPGPAGAMLVFVNGAFRADLSDLAVLPQGVELRPLSRALAADAEPLRFALAHHYRERGDAFARLNAAFAQDGVYLRVARGTAADTPLRLVFIGAGGKSPHASHLRHVIALEQGASLTLVEQHLAGDPGDMLATHVADIQLRRGARLDHVVLQQAGPATTLARRSGYRIDEGAQVRLHVLEQGGALVRHDLHAELVGAGAAFESHGAFLPQARQHIDTQLQVRHQARDTRSAALWRGVADGRGRGVFRGAIQVAAGADGSDASLGNKNLLLSGQAEIDTKPELEIFADEVKAAHGATVGQLDERALFYLRSRGLPLEEARALLTAAFARAPFDSIADATLRAHVTGLLGQASAWA